MGEVQISVLLNGDTFQPESWYALTGPTLQPISVSCQAQSRKVSEIQLSDDDQPLAFVDPGSIPGLMGHHSWSAALENLWLL